MGGIAPYHIHMLCKDSFSGGRGYLPRDAGDLTLDEIYMLLADVNNLRRLQQKVRTYESLEGVALVQKDGMIHGRDEKGNLIKGVIKGKSLATRLREDAEAKRKKEAEEKAAAQQTGRRRHKGK